MDEVVLDLAFWPENDRYQMKENMQVSNLQSAFNET